VLAHQQDESKEEPYLLPLFGGQLYCRSVTYGGVMHVLMAKKRKSRQKGSKIFKAQKFKMPVRFYIS
jgi:hypothetical protein